MIVFDGSSAKLSLYLTAYKSLILTVVVHRSSLTRHVGCTRGNAQSYSVRQQNLVRRFWDGKRRDHAATFRSYTPPDSNCLIERKRANTLSKQSGQPDSTASVLNPRAVAYSKMPDIMRQRLRIDIATREHETAKRLAATYKCPLSKSRPLIIPRLKVKNIWVPPIHLW